MRWWGTLKQKATMRLGRVWDSYNALIRRLPAWQALFVVSVIWGLIMSVLFYLKIGFSVWPVTPLAIVAMWVLCLIYYKVKSGASLGDPLVVPER
jgi:hypothetical protein